MCIRDRSSLAGFAITSIKIEGVDHEFGTIPGVIEDVTNIILNLKQVRFKHIVDDKRCIRDSQKAVATVSKKDISNFKLRKKMPIGVMVTLRREQMYEFLERLVRVALPRIRDFKGIESKLDGRGNYTLGIQEQIIFPEINIDNITKILGMNITFVTSAKTDEEGYALLREFGLPFKNAKKD